MCFRLLAISKKERKASVRIIRVFGLVGGGRIRESILYSKLNNGFVPKLTFVERYTNMQTIICCK